MLSTVCFIFMTICLVLFIVRANAWARSGRQFDAAVAAFYLTISMAAAAAAIVTALTPNEVSIAAFFMAIAVLFTAIVTA
jgi:hypothetical protein